nr:MAG TPA: hypothetical protein [Caudoviricetes sp.]
MIIRKFMLRHSKRGAFLIRPPFPRRLIRSPGD